MKKLPPLALYVHIPWCVRKCPYCDFNSHESATALPVDDYVNTLIDDLKNDAHFAQGRVLKSIFFGGGTPSLFPGKAIGKVLRAAEERIGFEPNIEITLEANPGTTECLSFEDLFEAGVNRLSMGVQSFNDSHLQRLGRIHNSKQAFSAFDLARKAGFENINIDLMHGLPEQTPEQALNDLRKAISLSPKHISWYQLTIEPNTAFYNQPPVLPIEDTLADIQDLGQALLRQSKFEQYEVSAYTLQTDTTTKSDTERRSKHNLNYWHFGDYLGIGAGAHSKISSLKNDNSLQVMRRQKTRQPNDYLNAQKNYTSKNELITQSAMPLEFMMNALRLTEGVKRSLFIERTGLTIGHIDEQLRTLQANGLLKDDSERILLSPLGQRFLNSVLDVFMS